MLKPDVDSLRPGCDFNRRHVGQTTVGSGFAAAVLPVTAQAINTAADGLTAGGISIAVAGFPMPAYRAAPAGKSNLPVVWMPPWPGPPPRVATPHAFAPGSEAF